MNKFFLRTGTRMFFLCGLALPVGVHAQYAGQHAAESKVPVTIPVKASSFDLRDVRLLESPFKENMDREGEWLWSLP